MAPPRANSPAIASPIPPPAPVTRTTLSRRLVTAKRYHIRQVSAPLNDLPNFKKKPSKLGSCLCFFFSIKGSSFGKRRPTMDRILKAILYSLDLLFLLQEYA